MWVCSALPPRDSRDKSAHRDSTDGRARPDAARPKGVTERAVRTRHPPFGFSSASRATAHPGYWLRTRGGAGRVAQALAHLGRCGAAVGLCSGRATGRPRLSGEGVGPGRRASPAEGRISGPHSGPPSPRAGTRERAPLRTCALLVSRAEACRAASRTSGQKK